MIPTSAGGTAFLAALIVIQHFVFDWILQPRWVAINKSKNNGALLLHGAIVAFGFGLVATLVYPMGVIGVVTVIYGLLHILQDKIIWGSFKPVTDNPYQEKQFWNTVAVDQVIHLLLAILLLCLFRC